MPDPTEVAVVRKVMARLAPFLAILYVFCLLDRTNVSIAALTMKQDLRFSDAVYGLGAGIFFVGYFLFEVPSNLIMERVGARVWIARIMLTWGAISTGMMFIHTPTSYYVLRFILGIAEAGFYPGVILYITYWVPATSRAQAISRFLVFTAIFGLFGGPLGGALLTMNGRAGLAGWQWLFLLEGVPSMLLGLVVFALLPDNPVQARWLTEFEKEWLARRLAAESRNSECVQHLSLRVALSEPRILMMCLIFFITATAGNAIGFFGPQLIQARSGGRWSDSFVATIGVVPAIVGAIAMSIAAFYSDRTGRRRRHVFVGYSIAALAFALCVFAPNGWMVIAAFSLNTLGERIGAGSYWALTTNLLGARAAAGGIAMINSLGNLGGFFGPVIMGQLKQRTGGGYEAGLWTAAALMFVGAALAGALRRHPVHTYAVAELPDAAAAPPAERAVT